ELPQVHAGEGAPHREPFTLVARRGGGDLDHRPIRLRARLGDGRQDQEVLDGDGWHDDAPRCSPELSYPLPGQPTTPTIHERSTFPGTADARAEGRLPAGQGPHRCARRIARQRSPRNTSPGP